MRILKLKQIEYNVAPDSIKELMIKNQLLLEYTNSFMELTTWFENTLTPWMDQNILDLYSIDVLVYPSRLDVELGILYSKYSRNEDNINKSIVIFRFTNTNDMENFINQCIIWKLLTK